MIYFWSLLKRTQMNTNDWLMIFFMILDGILLIDMILRILHLTKPCERKKEPHVLTAHLVEDM
jgi:hypothetical protein